MSPAEIVTILVSAWMFVTGAKDLVARPSTVDPPPVVQEIPAEEHDAMQPGP